MKISENILVAVLASLLALGSFMLQGNIGLNLADEGYLWYGTERTALGDIPLRDFQSYPPGRYYWSAVWSLVFGNGIMGLRASVAIFQVIGLTLGLLTLRRLIRSWWLLFLAGCLLLLWMYPRHKLFEHSFAMAAVYFAVLVIEKPSVFRPFIAGIFVGIAGFFGQNHGVYGLVSFFLLIVFLHTKTRGSKLFRRIAVWTAGILVGWSPMFWMFMVIPGFFESFVEIDILFILRNKTTNIALPIPWPWTIDFSNLQGIPAARQFSVGLLFLLLPASYGLGGLALLWAKRDSLKHYAPLVGSLFVGVPYMHHAFSRADISHLAQAIHPLLIELLMLPFVFKPLYKKGVCIGLLLSVCILSFFSIGTLSPYYRKSTAPEGAFVRIAIRDDALWVPVHIANLVHTVERIAEEKIFPEEGVLIAPYWPGFYSILQRKAPIWGVYPTWKALESDQLHMISELYSHNVNWAILDDTALDGRDDLRFRNTHPLVWHYFIEEFEPVKAPGLPDNQQLLHRKRLSN